MNGIFEPEFSTNQVWFDDYTEQCLTEKLESMDDDIAALETGKANTVHTHGQYADMDHTHTGYAATNHTHTGYANVDHTHTGFASEVHSHSGYALATDVDALEEKVGDTSVSAQISSAIASKANVNHTHDGYALSEHSHNDYATVSHEHANYSLTEHTHSNYAQTTHEHDDYALVDHSHTGFASSAHIHSYNDLEDKPVIPTIPSSLPANGGNADTVDGKHASEFALATDMTAIQTLVGDSSVSSQISTAIQNIDMSDFATETYVNTQVSALVDSAPETLNTLNELAAALGDDPNFATTIATQIGSKVDKVTGKGLSTNDYTTSEKNKLAGVEAGANKTIVDSALSTTSTNPVQNKVIAAQLNNLSTLVGGASVSEQIADAISENAYTLPSAGSGLGGVKSGGDVTISAGVISVNDDSHNHVIANVDGLQSALDGKAASSHTHSNYVNQNAFSNVKVGTTTIEADTATDTLTLVAGSNITLTPDATNDKVTIAATNTVYTHPNSGVTAGTYKSVAVNAEGHVTSGSNPTTLSGYGITDAATKTELNNLSTLVGSTSVSEQISSAISAKADASHNHSASNITSGTLPIERGGTGATTAAAALQALGLTATAAELNKMDGITATTAELNYVDGVTSNIQAQLNEKAASSHTHSAATTSAAGLMSAEDKTKLNGIATGANKITVDSSLSSSSTNPVQNKVINAALNDKRIYKNIASLGITTFPTTMKLIAEAMPDDSMLVLDTRRINGVDTANSTETISDWGNTSNGVALIFRGISEARMSMLILYGTAQCTDSNIIYGSYAYTTNKVNWNNLKSNIDDKVDKVKHLSGVDLNTVTESGLYYVSSGTTALHYPTGSNGHMLVMSDGTRVRQVYFRVGTVDTNSFQWYSRHLGSDLTVGDNGWSKWWLLSGSESVWSGTAKLNAEINLGSRYGCQAWVIAGQVTNTDTYSTIYVPRQFLTTNQTKYKLQIADETGYVSFYFYYKESDDNVYAKIIWVSDTNNSALRYAYRVS